MSNIVRGVISNFDISDNPKIKSWSLYPSVASVAVQTTPTPIFTTRSILLPRGTYMLFFHGGFINPTPVGPLVELGLYQYPNAGLGITGGAIARSYIRKIVTSLTEDYAVSAAVRYTVTNDFDTIGFYGDTNGTIVTADILVGVSAILLEK